MDVLTEIKFLNQCNLRKRTHFTLPLSMFECHENLYAAAQLCEGEADGREMVGDGVDIKETEGRDQIEFSPLFLFCVSGLLFLPQHYAAV